MNTFSTNGFKSELSFLLHYYLFIHLFKTLRSCSQHNLYPFCFYSTRLLMINSQGLMCVFSRGCECEQLLPYRERNIISDSFLVMQRTFPHVGARDIHRPCEPNKTKQNKKPFSFITVIRAAGNTNKTKHDL